MKTLIARVLRVWWMTALCVVLLALSGCRVKYVPVKDIHTNETEKHNVERDSIHVHDSVYIYMQGDTVFDVRWKTIYKEIFRTDTFIVNKTDTINHVVEVEKPLTKMQELKMDIGGGVLYAVPILITIGLYILYRKLKK